LANGEEWEQDQSQDQQACIFHGQAIVIRAGQCGRSIQGAGRADLGRQTR